MEGDNIAFGGDDVVVDVHLMRLKMVLKCAKAGCGRLWEFVIGDPNFMEKAKSGED